MGNEMATATPSKGKKPGDVLKPRLNLGGKNLSKVDASTAQFHVGIDELLLSYNDLVEIPEKIKHLKNLTALEVGSNQVKFVHPAIGTLEFLQKIVLYGNRITFIPKQLGRLGHLTHLDLTANRLSFLPNEIGNLSQLKVLLISSNLLETLPSTLSKLRNLKHLDAFSNLLKSIDFPLTSLWLLEELNLSHNALTSVTVSEINTLRKLSLSGNLLSSVTLKSLPRLVHLDLSNNEVDCLADFSGFPILTLLNLSNNKLTDVNPSISTLASLSNLNLQFNAIKMLPTEIGGLTSLRSLDVSQNCLTALPDTIADLKSLLDLNADYNLLTTLPPTISKLQNLHKIRVASNRLTSLPRELGQLPKLSILQVGLNFSLTDAGLPRTLFKTLNGLTEVSFFGCGLTKVPSGLEKQQSLLRLYLGYNTLVANSFSKGVVLRKNCKMLKEIILPGCSLDAIPKSFYELAPLQTLHLACNNISHIPPEIGKLSNLRAIDLSHNNLVEVPEQLYIATLKEINLSHNSLLSLPISVNKLEMIDTIDLSYNVNLKFLPDEIANLPSLITLHLEGCKFRKMPDFTLETGNMSWISVGGNPLSDIPFCSNRYVDGRGSAFRIPGSNDSGSGSGLTGSPKKKKHGPMAYVSEMCGMRPSMEDSFVIEKNIKDIKRGHVFAIYDGHGSHEAAHYLARHTVEELSRHPIDKKDDVTSRVALEHTYKALAHGVFDAGITSGATAVLAYIRSDVLWLAHCGDARALLIEDWKCKFATTDHKALSREERLRIQRLGGFLTENGRVCGNIAVARSIGDKAFQPFVSHAPDITKIPLEKSQYLILACDGVWDVISNEEAIRIMQHYSSNIELPKSQLAPLLRDCAYMLGSSDNISSMVVVL
eukprot:TRINITY_DN5473_c0_g1_i1.p1 TRINITY_DN5473_c0_g1~~TRINITY_DN5473_c0_g1_i1.p1  ORF type:complete len:890 (+),score=90.35 TRINITY_DN5473_c0_g1_i1:31-2670(+)